MSMVYQCMELILLHDIWWDDTNGDLHIGIVSQLYGSAQVKILEVPHHASYIGHGDNAVEQ